MSQEEIASPQEPSDPAEPPQDAKQPTTLPQIPEEPTDGESYEKPPEEIPEAAEDYQNKEDVDKLASVPSDDFSITALLTQKSSGQIDFRLGEDAQSTVSDATEQEKKEEAEEPATAEEEKVEEPETTEEEGKEADEPPELTKKDEVVSKVSIVVPAEEDSQNTANEDAVSKKSVSISAKSVRISLDFISPPVIREESFSLQPGGKPSIVQYDWKERSESDKEVSRRRRRRRRRRKKKPPPKEGTEATGEQTEQERLEEEEEEAEEEEDIVIDRAMYYEMYAFLSKQKREAKMKNNFLQSRLASYFMRRKMMYVLREQTLHYEEMQSKYLKDLDELEMLEEQSDIDKHVIQTEIDRLLYRRNQKMNELDELFAKLQQEQLDYGKTLTHEKTGRHNMDKIVERFVRRQKAEMNLTIKLRMTYIKLRNKMNEKLRALEDLDKLGPGYRIMDYVQLKMDNRALYDKLEEKEAELVKLRTSCQNTMQVLAHNREKSAALDRDIDKLNEEMESVNLDYEDARANVYYIQRERNEIRNETKNLKAEHSLLVNKKLLRDMERCVEQLEELREQLGDVKRDYYDTDGRVKMVRKNIQYAVHHKAKQMEKVTGHDSDSSD